MSNGPSQFVRKNSHSITMEIFYVPSLSRLLVFSPHRLGPAGPDFWVILGCISITIHGRIIVRPFPLTSSNEA